MLCGARVIPPAASSGQVASGGKLRVRGAPVPGLGGPDRAAGCSTAPPRLAVPPAAGAVAEAVKPDHVEVEISGHSGQDMLSGYADGAHPHKHYIHRSNWLRAAVLGANDGLVSVAALTLGVGGASASTHLLIITSVAGLVAGALSMAVGEFISVSSQRDIELSEIERERAEQAKGPEAQAQELNELTQIYIERGLTQELARAVAEQLTAKDVIRAHARDELGIDMDDLVNPWSAALASAVSFAVGAFVPVIPLLIDVPRTNQIIGIIVAVTLALLVFGLVGAFAGGSSKGKGVVRVLLGGWLAMAATYGIGRAFHIE